MLRAADRRIGSGASAGARGHLRYAAVYRRPGPRRGTARPFVPAAWANTPPRQTGLSTAWVQRTWWSRLADDCDLIGAKLLVLAALLALTALLERVV
jgi:hypothetical protein